MKSFIYTLFVACLIVPVASAGVIVEMQIDGIPAGGSYYMIPPGSSLTIDFSITSDQPTTTFYGIVALEGVGTLSNPTEMNPGTNPPPGTPPSLPENTWPLFYSSWNQLDPPVMEIFASSVYNATEMGYATVKLYQTDAVFDMMTLIDSFDIQVTIIPEPATLGLLSLGALLIRKQK